MKNIRFTALALLAFAGTACKDSIEDLLEIKAVSGALRSTKLIPLPAPTSSAMGDISGRYTPSRQEIEYLVTYGGLSGSLTNASFYYGDVRHRSTRRVASFPVVASGNSTGRFDADFTITAQEADSLLAGRIYVLLSTSRYPDGEIRATLDTK